MPEDKLVSQERFIAHAFEALMRDKVFPAERMPTEALYSASVKGLEGQSFAKVYRITYKSDGLLVTGILVTPTEVKDRSHPFIVYNRGGNRSFGMLTAVGILRFLLPLSRRNNALVLATNYRGVDGSEGKDEMGGADLEDVLALVRIARAHPAWDGKTSLMIGGSRGGQMTYQALKAGAQVNAAATIAGPTDLWRSEAERPEMVAEHLATMPGYAIHREECLFARSAIRWPEAIHTPLLLLHGDADWRVDVSDSTRLAEALTALGRPHELVIYPGDDHGLTLNWEDAMKRFSDWLVRFQSR